MTHVPSLGLRVASLAVVLLAVTTSASIGQGVSRAALIAAIDSMATEALDRGPNAGLVVGVAKGGETLLAKGYGYANLEHRVPATAETVFRLGSITKQFTGVAIMQLVEAGKLRLDDPLHKYFPDYPAHARAVTIEDLIDHTSGIKNYTAIAQRLWLEDFRLDLTNDRLIDLFKGVPLDFEPRHGYNYSNSGFFLAGAIVEHVSGQSYADYLDEHIFAPLGMWSSSFCDQRAIVPHRAAGYDVADGQLANTSFISMKVPGAAGAVCSTAPDLITWQRALAEHRVLSASSYRRMIEPAALTNGFDVPYGGGLSQATLEGHRKIGHGGQVNGFLALAYYYPDDDLSVVVLANSVAENVYNPAGLEESIARLVLDLPQRPLAEHAISAGDLAQYVGRYGVGADEMQVVLEGGRLMLHQEGAPPLPLVFRGDHTFEWGPLYPMRLMFDVQQGRARRVLVSQAGIAIAVAERIADRPTDPEGLQSR